MNFPRFWARGEHGGFLVWRWSNSSLSEAQALAAEAARKLAERFATVGRERLQRYGYGEGAMREEVLRELRDASGRRIAAITRNSYGCLVLNTAQVMFIDVDLPEARAAGGLFARLFGGRPAAGEDGQARVLQQAEAWARSNAGWGWRVYRTRAGVRLAATHALFDPATSAANGVFDHLGADPLYRKLCLAQKCFRARLTPKPWRCGSQVPPARWPWPDPAAEARFRQWEERYLKCASSWATCRLIATLGNTTMHPDAATALQIHDEIAQVNSSLQLA